MRKLLACICSAVLLLGAAAGCTPAEKEPGDDGGDEVIDRTKLAQISPTVYDVDEIVTAEETEAGDVQSWQAQVFTSNGGNNDDPTPNAVIHSPWHTLEINGTQVPVYTARCGKSSHSFAWVDVVDHQDDFILEVKLTMHRTYAQCVVLPESREVNASVDGKNITSYIRAYGSFTYTFATNENAKVTDPTMTPLTHHLLRQREHQGQISLSL